MTKQAIHAFWVVTMALLMGCSQEAAEPAASTPAAPASSEAAGENSDWAQHGHDAAEQRFSPLAQISTDNVADLGLAWFYELPVKRGQEATPIVVDGVMYTSSAWNHVIALNAATGEVLWHFDPKVPKSMGVKSCCDAVNRGVAYDDGKVFTGTLDGRLISLDAKTGAVNWSVVTIDQSKRYTITGAPRVANGKVFIGNGGAEYGVRGYISAYDANSGDMVWRFYTVPGGPDDPTGVEPVEAQKPTWKGEWWKLGGGGTVWDSMAFDPELNLLYFGVGNGSPWNPNIRTQGEGDNLFISSIVAVDADSGEYRWHYQTTPMEAWDYTATQHIILADMELEGTMRKVLMQAPKNGFFYVLDRVTGEFLSGEPYVPVNWASHIDKATGRPVVLPEAQYWKTGVTTLATPSWMGGHNWHPMSYNPPTGLVYIPAQQAAFPYLAEDDQTPSVIGPNLGVDTTVAAFPDNPEVIQQIKDATFGFLLAWDPVAQKEVWRFEYPGAWNGGVLSTAGGLVFQGNAVGFVQAFDAVEGKKLWEFPAQTGIVAPPISYQVNGEQYIAISAGWGGTFPLMTGPLTYDSANGDPINRSRLLVFKLGGTAKLPDVDSTRRELPDYSSLELDAERAKQGFALYDRYCINCHGAGAIGGGVLPDLRYSGFTASSEAWTQVVINGILQDNGMASFAVELSPEDAESIRHYIIERNHYARSIGDTTRLSR